MQKSSEALQRILQRYEAASGQLINPEKSAITFSRWTPASLKQTIRDTLSIQKEGGTGKYVGLPELFGRKKRDLFTSIVDRIQQKAKSWSNRHLSSAGKMTMLRSVLSPIPSYSMTCFKLFVSLYKRIQSALTRFWWDDRDRNRKMSWIAWDTMTLPKDQGGLDFRDIESINEAFLTKLSWRIVRYPKSLLARILLGKYCSSDSFLSAPIPSACSHGWRGIMLGRNIISNNSGWAVGNGMNLNVWEDPWLSSSSQTRTMGPAPESLVNLTVAELFQSEENVWSLEKIRQFLPFHEQEILAIKPSFSGAPDKLIWLNDKTGEFTTKSGL